MKAFKLQCSECGKSVAEAKHPKTGRTILVCTDPECDWHSPDLEVLVLAASELLVACGGVASAADDLAGSLAEVKKAIARVNELGRDF